MKQLTDEERAELRYEVESPGFDGDGRMRALLDENDALATEVERLKRAAEWLPTDSTVALTEEQLRGIKLRWATGPEDYQQDADALICGILRERAEVGRLRARLAAIEEMRDSVIAEADAAIARAEAAENESGARLLRAMDAEEQAATERAAREKAEAEVERLQAEVKHQREMRADDLCVTVASRREADGLRADLARLTRDLAETEQALDAARAEWRTMADGLAEARRERDEAIRDLASARAAALAISDLRAIEREAFASMEHERDEARAALTECREDGEAIVEALRMQRDAAKARADDREAENATLKELLREALRLLPVSEHDGDGAPGGCPGAEWDDNPVGDNPCRCPVRWSTLVAKALGGGT